MEVGILLTNQLPRGDGQPPEIYALDAKIGHGGMATVYRATVQSDGRQVAVKCPHDDRLSDAVFHKRFISEAGCMSQVIDANVARIFDFGIDTEGRPFLVMELFQPGVAGVVSVETLAQVIKRCVGAHRPGVSGKIVKSCVPLVEALDYLDQIVDGLAAIHAAGLVHRDLKPDNILIVGMDDGTRRAVLMDFGIARDTKIDPDKTRLTHETQILGTPYYFSPELVFGSRDAGKESDIWQVGVILYEMVSGRTPFHDAKNLQQLVTSILCGAPRPIGELVEGLNPGVLQMLQQCLAREPANRPQSMDAMRENVSMIRACERVASAEGSSSRLKLVVVGLMAAIVAAIAVLFLTPRESHEIVPGFAVTTVSGSVSARTSRAPSSATAASITVTTTTVSATPEASNWTPGPGPTPPSPTAATNPRSGRNDYAIMVAGLSAAAATSVCSPQTMRELHALVAKFSGYPPLIRALADCEWKSKLRDLALAHYDQYRMYAGVDPLPPGIVAELEKWPKKIK